MFWILLFRRKQLLIMAPKISEDQLTLEIKTQEEKLGISTAPLIAIELLYIVLVVIVDVAVIVVVVVSARKTRESLKASCPLLFSRRRCSSSSCSRTTTTRCARSSASATRSADRLPTPPTEKHCK